MTNFPDRRSPHARRAFTLVELIVASMVAAFLLTAVTFSLSRLAESRNLASERAEAFQRAATALESVRREVAAVIRSDDLFDTRLLIAPPASRGFGEGLLRSDVLLFSDSMRSMRAIDYQGEGREYESQFRIEEDGLGTALWHRRDNVPDEVPDGGGLATPVADGVLSLVVEASDGESGWRDEWDSDIDGLPRMVRISVTATGAPLGAEPTDRTPEVLLRTVVAVDRVVPPKSEAPPPTDEGMGGTESQGQSGTGPAGIGDAGPAGGGGGGGVAPLPDGGGPGGRPTNGGTGGGRTNGGTGGAPRGGAQMPRGGQQQGGRR